jgi:predicted nucleic acid-binding protein
VSVAIDSSLVLALYDGADEHHADAVAWMRDADDELVTTPLVLAELDHLLGSIAPKARAALYDDFERGALVLRWWADALDESIAIARARPELGLADASLVALAARLRTHAIATFDHEHFRPLTSADGTPFVLLPADAT